MVGYQFPMVGSCAAQKVNEADRRVRFYSKRVITEEANNKGAGGKPIWNKSGSSERGKLLLYSEESTYLRRCEHNGAMRVNFIGLIFILLKL